MTILIVEVRSSDGRVFEVHVSFDDQLVVAESCIEILPGRQREWRDARSVLLLVDRKPGGAA